MSKSVPTQKKSKSEKSPACSGRLPVQCVECKKTINAKDQALFVEEEVGRYFCTEACIVASFTPDIEKLEREYGRHVAPNDLSSEEREKYAHLRWMTLEDPSEVWMEKTPKGDHRHVLISEFKPDSKKVYAVAVCLMLRNEPSFLYLAFVTSDKYLVDVFRKGEKVKLPKKTAAEVAKANEALAKRVGSFENPLESTYATADETEELHPGWGDNVHSINGGRGNQQSLSGGLSGTAPTPVATDTAAGLAEPWTEADSLHVNILKSRKQNDIPVEDFGFYQKCLEDTLQNPNELWSYLPKSAKRVYHFLKKFTHDQDYWYVVIAKDTADESQIEIVDAFPTRDASMVQLCRHGRKENLGTTEAEIQEQAEEEMPMAVGESRAAGKKAGRNVH
jgi:hypothetical protein